MFEMSKLGIQTFSRFVFKDNFMKSEKEEENKGAIAKFFFSQKASLNFENWKVERNIIGHSPVINLDYHEEPNMKKFQMTPGL